ncbi:MAG: FAD-dependent oxidoreductase [Planctomycetes bacterium]|nr:FAD-dependent oxidoreductase [Planctomycetota bacterium]
MPAPPTDELRVLFTKAKLPTSPALAAQILELAEDPDSTVEQFAEIIQMDPALAARLLRMTNSAAYAQRTPVTSIRRAVALLGLNRVRTVSLGFQLVGHLNRLGNCPFDMKAFWRQSILRACLAREFAEVVVPPCVDEAFLIGLLQDSGILLLVQLLGEPYAELYASAHLSPTAFLSAEREQFPHNHVNAVVMMGREWKLPETIIRHLAKHHTPTDLSESSSDEDRLSAVSYLVGSLRLALCDERVEEFNRLAAVANQSGLEVSFLSNDAAREKWPLIAFDRVKSVLWCPSDGYLQPTDLAMAYRAFAKARGVRFATGTQVERVVVEDGRVVGVETNRGAVACSTVVNAAGAHAYHIAQSVGLRLPIVPVRHEYFITVTADGMRPDLPVVRIPDATLYLRAEVNSLLVGGWEPASVSSDPRDFPLDRPAPPIEPDWEALDGFSRQLAPHIPQVRELGIRSVQKGWPTFTPDGRFIIGPSSRVRGFVMAGGCNAHGVSGSAGIGRHVVESMFEAEPSEYVKSLSPDRFSETDWDWETAARQARALYESYYHVGH